jgi:hypothetical protein
MIHLKITMDYTTSEPDQEYLAALNKREVIEAKLLEVAAVPEGTKGGKTTVGLIIRLPDGRFVWAETTLALFQAANTAFTARYGAVHS